MLQTSFVMLTTLQNLLVTSVACTINIVTIVIDDSRDHKYTGLYYYQDYDRNWWLYKHITIVNGTVRVMLYIVASHLVTIYECKLFIVLANDPGETVTESGSFLFYFS
jgi:hypothetical protein